MKREPRAIVVVADDASTSISGKLTLSGIYSNITLPEQEITIPQLVFCFFVEFPLSTAPEMVTVEIALPGVTAVLSPVQLPPRPPIGERAADAFRLIIPMLNPVLRPGRVQIKIHHGNNSFDVLGPVITMAPSPAPASTSATGKDRPRPRIRRDSKSRGEARIDPRS